MSNVQYIKSLIINNRGDERLKEFAISMFCDHNIALGFEYLGASINYHNSEPGDYSNIL